MFPKARSTLRFDGVQKKATESRHLAKPSVSDIWVRTQVESSKTVRKNETSTTRTLEEREGVLKKEASRFNGSLFEDIPE